LLFGSWILVRAAIDDLATAVWEADDRDVRAGATSQYVTTLQTKNPPNNGLGNLSRLRRAVRCLFITFGAGKTLNGNKTIQFEEPAVGRALARRDSYLGKGGSEP